jgi:hypothetical protein
MKKYCLIPLMLLVLTGAGCGKTQPAAPTTNPPPVSAVTEPVVSSTQPTAAQIACRASTPFQQFTLIDERVSDQLVTDAKSLLPSDVRDKTILFAAVFPNASKYTALVFLTCGEKDDEYTSYLVLSNSASGENKLIATLPSYTTSNSANVYAFAFWLGDTTEVVLAGKPYGFGAGGSCQDVPYKIYDAVSGKLVREISLSQQAVFYAANFKAVDTDNPCVVGNKIYGIDFKTGEKSVLKKGGSEDFFTLGKVINKNNKPVLRYSMNGENTERELALP